MRSGRAVRRELAAPILAAGLILLAAFPWLLGISYSKGNDFFYWLHFAWWLGPHLLEGKLPDWTMLSGCGQPAFNLDHLPDAIALALLTSGFGIEGGIRVFVILCYGIGGAGTYVLARDLSGNRHAALVAMAAYLFSWYLTRTADFYVYTSNLLQFVLLPWVICCFRHAVSRHGMLAPLGAACLVALCVLANPQTAIKVAGLASLWVLLERQGGASLGKHLADRLKTVGLIGGAAAWLSAFHIATALIHRREIYTFGERGGRDPQAWKAFFYLPLLAAQQLAAQLGLAIDVGLPMKAVTNAHYWGLSVLLLGLLALCSRRRTTRARVLLLWGLSGLGVLLFLVSSLFKPSEWLGVSRNMLFIPVFCGALLCGFGALRVIAWLRLKKRPRLWQALPLMLVLVELGGLKVALYRLGPHHLPLREIPQLGFWQQISASQPWSPGERFYTFQSDLAFMLYPAFTGRPTANRIHQRDYLGEFCLYQDDLNWQLSQPPPYRPVISEYLGLLNIRYLDVPQEGFSGRFQPHYAQLLEHLAADPGLLEIARRYPGAPDRQWNRYMTLNPKIPALETGMPAQVVYVNQRAKGSFLPEKTVAILGEGGARYFEELTLTPGFKFDRILYLLCPDEQALAGVEAAMAGIIRAGPAVRPPADSVPKEVGPEELAAFYAAPAPDHPQPRIETWAEERIVLSLPASDQERFVEVALQRFKDWHAYDGQGQELRVFKAGAGMSAIHLPPGTEQLVLQYERPFYKTGWRYFSLAGLAAVVGLAVRRRAGAARRTPSQV